MLQSTLILKVSKRYDYHDYYHPFLSDHPKRPQFFPREVKAQREQFASAEAEAKEKTQKAEAVWDGKGSFLVMR